MMEDREIDIVEGLLKPDFEVLEFGSGYSTCYFSKFVKHWSAIEHNADWFDRVIKLPDFTPTNVTMYLSNERDYLNCAKRIGKKFDLILIDGIRRDECLDLSWKLVKEGATILLHDASRFEYSNWIDKYLGTMLIEGVIPDERASGYYMSRGLKLWRFTFV